MTEIDQYEREVLEKTFYPEKYSQIIEECNMDEYIAADCLRSLIRKKLVNVLRKEEVGERYVRSSIYDSDHLELYCFQASLEGMEFMDMKK